MKVTTSVQGNTVSVGRHRQVLGHDILALQGNRIPELSGQAVAIIHQGRVPFKPGYVTPAQGCQGSGQVALAATPVQYVVLQGLDSACKSAGLKPLTARHIRCPDFRQGVLIGEFDGKWLNAGQLTELPERGQRPGHPFSQRDRIIVPLHTVAVRESGNPVRQCRPVLRPGRARVSEWRRLPELTMLRQPIVQALPAPIKSVSAVM
jgi:hypothetical protein